MVLLLLICTSAYCHQLFPAFMDRKKDKYVETAVLEELEGDLLTFAARCGVSSGNARG
jgi:hypothetical protein